MMDGLLNQLMQQLKMPDEVRFEDGSIGKRRPAPKSRQNPPIREIKYPRSNPETGYYDAGPMSAPQEAIKYPRSNPETGFYDAGPASQIQYPRSNPQTGYYQAGPNAAPQMRRAEDPMAQFRMLLGL